MESIGVELFDDVIVGELKSLLYRPTRGLLVAPLCRHTITVSRMAPMHAPRYEFDYASARQCLALLNNVQLGDDDDDVYFLFGWLFL